MCAELLGPDIVKTKLNLWQPPQSRSLDFTDGENDKASAANRSNVTTT